MLRVLVVSANRERLPDPVAPLGATYVAAAARRAGHEVGFFDACLASEPWRDRLAARLADFRPDVVGLSMRNVDDVAWPRATTYLPLYRDAVATIRERAASATLVLGGSAFTIFPREFLDALGAEHGIAGEGERAFVDLLARLERGERPPRLLEAAPGSLDALTPPARDLVDLERYVREGGSANVQTKRGCGFRCTYCAYPLLEGRAVRTRSPVLVADELEELSGRGIRDVFFVDNVWNVPSEHAARVCEEILRRRLRVRWTAYATPAGLTRELLELMARAGCRSLDLGTDSASAPVLEALGKSFRPADVRNVSAWCHEAGIRFAHSLVFGGPGETWETFEETVATIDSVRPTSVIAIAGVRIYPGTDLAERAVAEGRVRREEVGLEPVFYVAPAVADGLVERLARVAADHPSWVVPGLRANLDPALFERLRAAGARGPLWTLLG